jgi:putative component of membrane protein insertase Oxa1/YidC/SpoIIIJ protein YidD
MQASMAVWAINFYRKHLSKRKGFHCAYGVATGKATCSGVGLRAFKKAGWVRGYALMRRQFDRCAICADELGAQNRVSIQNKVSSGIAGARRSRAIGASQAGFVDCDVCGAADCNSCDAPSCELPDVPSCEMPALPSCAMPVFPSCASAAEGAGGLFSAPCNASAWEFLYCVDCSGPCSNSSLSSSGASRAQRAKERQEEVRKGREQRRDGKNKDNNEEDGDAGHDLGAQEQE